MKKYAIVASLLILSSPLAHAMSDAELAGFCEDRATEYRGSYQSSQKRLEASVAGQKDISEEIFEILKPKLALSTNKDIAVTTYKALIAYKKEYDGLVPAALKNNQNAIDKLLSKHGLLNLFEQSDWPSSSLSEVFRSEDRYNESRATKLFKRMMTENPSSGYQEGMWQYGYSSYNLSSSALGKWINSSPDFTLATTITDYIGGDNSGRELKRVAKISMSITENGLVFKTLDSKVELTAIKKTEDTYVKEEITMAYPECLSVLNLK